MRIEQVGEHFVIARGVGRRTSWFCFFVDYNKSSWSKRPWAAQGYTTHAIALERLNELKSRAKVRALEGKETNG